MGKSYCQYCLLFRFCLEYVFQAHLPPKPPRMGGGGANSLDSQISLPDNNDSKEETSEDYVVTYKSYSDYFTDYELTADKMTEKDFTGTGSASNPFNVYSTRGFIYLSTQFNGRYTNLHCDIVLNEETFDENGTPSGGDGVVYRWRVVNGYRAIMNGNGHSIFGMYINGTSSMIGLFDTSGVALIENVKMEKFFVKGGDYVSPFGYRVLRIANCVSNGFVSGKYSTSGFFININSEARNCDNYSNIKSVEKEDGSLCDRAGGCFIFVENGAVVENCNNYGDIVTHWYGGGIIGEYHNLKGTLKNCNNYGNIKGTNAIGGIVSALYQGELTLINCNNYGIIGDENLDISSVGGIVGYVGGTISISGCNSYGKIYRKKANDYCGGIVGKIGGSGVTEHLGTVYIDDCYAEIDCETQKKSNVIVGIVAGEYCELIVKNSKFKINNFDKITTTASCYLHTNTKKTSIENIEIEVLTEDKTIRKNFYLFSKNPIIDYKIDANNILVKASFNVQNSDLFSKSQGECCKNYIISSNGAKYYGGSNFSNFFYSWKKGEILLGGISGNSIFQNKIDEDWLQRNGYTKKEVV